MIRGSDVINTLAALFAVIWLGGCADATMPQPQAQPGGAPNDVYRMGTVTVTAQCDPYLSLDWCAPGECMAISAVVAEPTSWSSTCGPTSGLGGGGGGGGTGTPGGSGSGLPGDADGDGDTLDQGPLAFAGCMAIKLGAGGWSAIGGTAFSAYQVWAARSSTAEAERRYLGYNLRAGMPDYSHDMDLLYWRMWMDAKDAETMMYNQLAAAGTWAAAELLEAAIKCSATALIPAA
jgi:hypothetical protein